MISLKKRSEGFTIVELLIVIVVIGILATLVIVTFTGIQQKARDTQRKTDVDAVASHVEAFYASEDKGYYPMATNMSDSTWVSTNLKGLDPEALKDPKGTNYTYTSEGDGGTVCDNNATPCTSFTISATLEADGSTYTKKSNT
jgi:general secretion pathway protein G